MKGSHWSKIERADRHLDEIKRLLIPYDETRPYEIRHTIEGEHDEHVYRMWPVEERDLAIAIVMGDFLFNLRSALDHLRVALGPADPTRGYFPLFTEDIWTRNPETGKRSRGAERAHAKFEAWTAGIEMRAVAQIDYFQPFRWTQRHEGANLALAILERLNNADKHRDLVAIGTLMKPRTITVGGITVDVSEAAAGESNGPGTLAHRSDCEVKVQAAGALQVTVGTARDAVADLEVYPLPDVCDILIQYVAAVLLELDRFTDSPAR